MRIYHLKWDMPFRELRPMSEFDPGRPSFVHDKLNGRTLEWQPDWREDYVQNAREHGPGVVEWDGRLLDGWLPFAVSTQ